ncbi:MAG: hypothetical protein KDB00_27545 [Planctomycetales bacterium]|nr:hypothetical protein [Planctomycetales bacterium]
MNLAQRKLIARTFAFCAMITLAIVGCDSVSIDKPIGQKIGESQRKLLIGRWETHDHNLIELRWHSSGYLVAGTASWDDKNQQFKASNEKIEMRTIGDSAYAFMATDGRYSFARIEFQDDDHIRIYPAEPDKFRSAVENGLLPGTVQEKERYFNVFVDSSNEKTIAFFKSTDWKHYFHDDPKMVLVRRPSPENDP